jgi:hypothetical protein
MNIKGPRQTLLPQLVLLNAAMAEQTTAQAQCLPFTPGKAGMVRQEVLQRRARLRREQYIFHSELLAVGKLQAKHIRPLLFM